MRESRLFRIVYYLLQNGKATASELAQKFEVSIRTIYREIDSISSAGIPIYLFICATYCALSAIKKAYGKII